jgi:hypothetical protein
VLFGDRPDHDSLPPPERASDADDVAHMDLAMGPGGATVDLDLPALAGALRFRSRLEQAGDVEPDIEPYGDGLVFHRLNGRGAGPLVHRFCHRKRPVPLFVQPVENKPVPL